MVKRKKQPSSQCYVAPDLKGDDFSYTAHVHIRGDVHLRGKLIVGGNLTVDGSLRAEDILCLGSITVSEFLISSTLYVGFSVSAGGSIDAGIIKTNVTVEKAASDIVGSGLFFDFDEVTGAMVTDGLVHSDIADEQTYERDINYIQVAVSAGDYILCSSIDANGDVVAGDSITIMDGGFIHGWIMANDLDADDELTVIGGIECRGNIVGVTIEASLGISCAGNCEVQNNLSTDDGDISVGVGLEVFGSVSADGSIHVGQSIKVGDSLRAGGDVSCNGNCNVLNSVTSVCGDVLTLGYLTAGGDVRAGDNIQAGRWIGVGGRLHAGAFIKAGECVVGEQGIVAGADYGILAGLCIPRSEWDQRGYVSSKKRPRNIISGHFVAGVTIDKLVSNRADTDGVPIG